MASARASFGSQPSTENTSDEEFSDAEPPARGAKRGTGAASGSRPGQAAAGGEGQQVQMKACSKCKEVKPAATSFWKDPTKSSGYTSWCKACFNQQAEKRKAEGPVVVSERECSICKLRKPADAFMKDSRRITGLDARCRECRRAQHAARKQRNIEAGNKMWDEKECKRCHIVKPAAMFKRHAYTASGLDSWCKECCRERRKELLAQKAAQQAGGTNTPETKECVACTQVKPSSEFARDRGQASGLSRRCKACEKEYRRSKRQCVTPTSLTPTSLTPTTLSPCPSPHAPASPTAAAMLMQQQQGAAHLLFNQQQLQQQQQMLMNGASASAAMQLHHPLPDMGSLFANASFFNSSVDTRSTLPAFGSTPLPSSSPLLSPTTGTAAMAGAFSADHSHSADMQPNGSMSSAGGSFGPGSFSSACHAAPPQLAPAPQPKKQSAFAVAPILPQGLLESMGRAPSQSWAPVVSSGVPPVFRTAGSGSSQEQGAASSPHTSGLCPSPNASGMLPPLAPVAANGLQQAGSAGGHMHTSALLPHQSQHLQHQQQLQQQQLLPLGGSMFQTNVASAVAGMPPPQVNRSAFAPMQPSQQQPQQQQPAPDAYNECFNAFTRDATLQFSSVMADELKDLLSNSLTAGTTAAGAMAAAAAAMRGMEATATAGPHSAPQMPAASASTHAQPLLGQPASQPLLPTGAALAAALPPVPPLVNLDVTAMSGISTQQQQPQQQQPPLSGSAVNNTALRGDSFAILTALKWDSLINHEMRLDSILGDSLAVPNPAQRIASLVGATIPAAVGTGPDTAMPMPVDGSLAAASRDNSLMMLVGASRDPSIMVVGQPASRDPSMMVMGQPPSRDASLMMMLQQPASRDVSLWGVNLDPALQAALQAAATVPDPITAPLAAEGSAAAQPDIKLEPAATAAAQ